MPVIVTVLSVLGLAPFIYFGFGAVGHIPGTAQRMLVSLIDYAGLILAFAGGVHWGLALLPGAARPTARVLAGAAPLIVAWIALVLANLIAPSVALAILIAGYCATAIAEDRAARRVLVPRQYVWVRVGFSVVAILMMAMVLILNGVGQTIVF